MSNLDHKKKCQKWVFFDTSKVWFKSGVVFERCREVGYPRL